MKFRKAALGLLAVVLVLGALIQPVLAYFTCNTDAKGVVPIVLGKKTEIEETFDNWTKHLTVSNDPDSEQDVYIRARAYTGSTYQLSITPANGWSAGSDGWYYYADPVAPGGSTSALDVEILNVPATPEGYAAFNVAIVYESAPVYHDEDGSPLPADWDIPLDVVTETYTGGETP